MSAARADPSGQAVRAAGRRVLIDALPARLGGTAYAAVHLARQLTQRLDVAAVTVLTRRGSIVQRGLARDPDVMCVELPAAARGELIRRTAWQALRMPALAAGEACDVLISMSGMLPRSPGCAVMCLLFNPVMYEQRTPSNALRRWAVRRTARGAVLLAAPSRTMAELVSASTRRECEVVPLGVDHDVFAPGVAPGEEILCVADFYAHKRHDLLLDAWLGLTAPRPPLHLVGNPAADPQTHASLLARINSLGVADLVAFESGIPLGQLVAAYHRARVFVMPSEHESFCMPLLESMSCGVPPLVRSLPSLRDTGADGASYVEDDDPAAWTAALARLIEDDTAHERAREAALARAASFSWEALAADLAAHF